MIESLYQSNQIKRPPSQIVLWMCLAARFMVEMDKIRTQGRQFFKHAGNVVDLSVSCCIIFTVLLRFVAYAKIYDAAKYV